MLFPASSSRYLSAMPTLPAGPLNVPLATVRYLRDPYGVLLAAARRYGDPYSWPSFFGKLAITGEPAGAKEIFSADPDDFSAIGADLLAPVLGEHNLILLSGDRHRAMRKIQTPPFHAQRLHVYGELILRITEQHIARWPKQRPFSLHRCMQEISLDVILHVVFGLDDEAKRESFRTGILALIGSLKPTFMLFRGLRRPLGGLSAWARFQRRTAEMTALFKAEVNRRRADKVERQDILSLFLGARHEDGTPLGDDELLHQMINLVGAGHETTASALAWAVHYVLSDPAVEHRLREELASVPPVPADPEALTRLPYLGAVCAETLRINPVAPLIGRTLRRTFTLQGHELPAGVSVGIGIINIHHREDIYPDPTRFRPERFLEREYGPFEYLPFGGGARRCLGAAFALYEMKLILATVLKLRTLRPVGKGAARAVMRHTTVGPANGVPMRIA